MKVEHAPDVKERVDRIVGKLGLTHVDPARVVCMRSHGSSSNAHARIWSMPSIWQKALGIEPHYVIEVISERYDAFSEDQKDRTLIHELMHVPKTFSGALRSHRAREFDGKGGHKTFSINTSSVEKMFRLYRSLD